MNEKIGAIKRMTHVGDHNSTECHKPNGIKWGYKIKTNQEGVWKNIKLDWLQKDTNSSMELIVKKSLQH